MVVVADTSRLNYLILTGHADILPQLYREIVIPIAVLRELRHPKTPEAVSRWVESTPEWLVIEQSPLLTPDLDPQGELDPGEREAISIAFCRRPDCLLLMDENKGRREAERHGIETTGTLGILDTAAGLGLLDLRRALETLHRTNFHVSSRIVDRLLQADAARAKARR